MTKKYHSKKSLLCQLTLATTSILLLHSQTVFAEEQQGSDASVSQASPVVAVEATATGDNSQAAASNQAASEIEAKEEKVLSAFAEGTESSAPTNLSLNDSVNAKALQEQTQKGSGAVIAVIDVSFDPEHDAFKLDSDLKNSGTIPAKEAFLAKKQDFKVQVKTSLPELPKSASYDESTRTLKIDASNFPAYRIQVGHIVEIGEGEEADIVINYFQLAEDGTVIIPKTVTSELSGEEVEVDMAALKVIVEDEFGNFNAIALADLLKQKEPEIKDDKQPEPETPMPEQPKGNDSSKEQQSPKGNNSGSKQPLVMKQDSAVKPMTSSPSHELPKTSEKQGSSLLAGLGMLLASLSLGLFKKKSDN